MICHITATLAPGTVSNTSGGGLGNFSSFGMGADTNLFTINGMDDNDVFDNLNNTGATNLMLGNNEVQEVSVVGNAYSAAYGGLSGAQINIVTRGGTNEFHGRATYYWNGRAMNANSYFNNAFDTPRSFVNANQWGADIGGPLIKNKVFWYFNTEGLYLVVPTSDQTSDSHGRHGSRHGSQHRFDLRSRFAAGSFLQEHVQSLGRRAGPSRGHAVDRGRLRHFRSDP